MEYWSTGVLEYWSTGVLEYWSIGVLEYWSIGVLEYWSTGPSPNCTRVAGRDAEGALRPGGTFDRSQAIYCLGHVQ